MLTPLDTAHADMVADPENDDARLGYFARLIETEMHLLLAEEATEDDIAPQVLDVDGAVFVVAFDTPARLSDHAGDAAPYAALPGKALVEMLADQGVGIALNPDLETAASFLIPADAVDWLARMLADAPEETEARITGVAPPGTLPDAVLKALDTCLARAGGLAEAAWLVTVREASGREGPLLGIVEPAPGAETALAQAVRDAVALSGAEAGFLDVAFFSRDNRLVPVLKRQGLRFELPQVSAAPEPKAPGLDPDTPPSLR